MIPNLTNEQKLVATIYRDVQAVCQETCHLMGTDVTKSVTEVIGELVYKKLKVYAKDLEAFAKHAKRTTINIDDVKLLVRRNPSLKSSICKISALTPENKKRKTIASTAKKKKIATSPVIKPLPRPNSPVLSNPVLSSKLTAPEDDDDDDFEEPMNVDNSINLTL